MDAVGAVQPLTINWDNWKQRTHHTLRNKTKIIFKKSITLTFRIQFYWNHLWWI